MAPALDIQRLDFIHQTDTSQDVLVYVGAPRANARALISNCYSPHVGLFLVQIPDLSVDQRISPKHEVDQGLEKVRHLTLPSNFFGPDRRCDRRHPSCLVAGNCRHATLHLVLNRLKTLRITANLSLELSLTRFNRQPVKRVWVPMAAAGTLELPESVVTDLAPNPSPNLLVGDPFKVRLSRQLSLHDFLIEVC